MGEFSPVQLDALEDALEDLELSGIPAEFDDDVAVSGRLSEYRDLLQLSREALPPVDVPAGVLDSVLAAARDEAALPSVASPPRPDDAAESKTPWWRRFSVWMPALAVGASAALVLVMVRGTLSDAEPASTTVATADASKDMSAAKDGALLERAGELRAAAEPLADADDPLGGAMPQSRGRLRGSAAVDRGQGDDAAAQDAPEEEAEMDEETSPAVPPTAPSPEPTDPEPTDKVLYEKSKGGPPKASKEHTAKPRKASPSRTSGKKQDVPMPLPESKPSPKPAPAEPEAKSKSKSDAKPKPEPPAGGGTVPGGSSDAPSESLSSADANRRKGRCGSARSVYRTLVDHSDATIRARALAGLGLCALSEGDEKGADAYFSRARKADSSIGSFISRERDATEDSTKQAL